MQLKQIANRHPNFIYISGCLTSAIFIMSGIGSFRHILVYGIYSLLKALNAERRFLFLFAPAYLVTFYLDVTIGPMFPIFAKNYFFVVFPSFIIADNLVHNLFKKLIANLTEGRYFVICPSCHFNNIHLVEACTVCSYNKWGNLLQSAVTISPSFKGDEIAPWLLNLIRDSTSDEIAFHKKLNYSTQKRKNGVRVARKHLIITTRNLIILDYFGFQIRHPEGWRERDLIPLSEIVAVDGEMQEFYKTLRPFIIIKTIHNDVYEIALSKFEKYVDEIKQIATIMKNANTQVEVNINLPEPSWKEQQSNTSTWQMLVLIIILMMTVFYALWQSFPHLAEWGFK